MTLGRVHEVSLRRIINTTPSLGLLWEGLKQSTIIKEIQRKGTQTGRVGDTGVEQAPLA